MAAPAHIAAKEVPEAELPEATVLCGLRATKNLVESTAARAEHRQVLLMAIKMLPEVGSVMVDPALRPEIKIVVSLAEAAAIMAVALAAIMAAPEAVQDISAA